MKRRSFLKWLGFGAAAIAVPAVASAAPETSGMALMAEAGQTIGEVLTPYAQTIWINQMRQSRDWRFGTQWSAEEMEAMDRRQPKAPPLVFNQLRTVRGE